MTDVPAHEGAPTCPICGATRSPAAVPYQDADHDFAVYTCASCGHRFESWSSGAPVEEPGHTSGQAAD